MTAPDQVSTPGGDITLQGFGSPKDQRRNVAKVLNMLQNFVEAITIFYPVSGGTKLPKRKISVVYNN